MSCTVHETSLVRALLGQVLALASERQAVAVDAVRVRVGELSGVEPTLLTSAWDAAVRATRAHGARLTIVATPLAARCTDCGERFAPIGFRFVCPRCGGPRAAVEQGEELILESVDLRVAEEAESCR